MSTSGSKSNEHVAHFLVDIHNLFSVPQNPSRLSSERGFFYQSSISSKLTHLRFRAKRLSTDADIIHRAIPELRHWVRRRFKPVILSISLHILWMKRWLITFSTGSLTALWYSAKVSGMAPHNVDVTFAAGCIVHHAPQHTAHVFYIAFQRRR